MSEVQAIAARIAAEMGRRHISYGELAHTTGLSKSTLQRYATGQTRKIPADRLERIAAALGVSTAALLGDDAALVHDDRELTAYLEELKNRDEMRMLFSLARGCTREEVEQAVRIIEVLRKQE
jgi:transcriptional regulator with XRE-family HTH domain